MIGFIVFGLVVGVLARVIVPGRQHLSLAMTVGLALATSGRWPRLLLALVGLFFGALLPLVVLFLFPLVLT